MRELGVLILFIGLLVSPASKPAFANQPQGQKAQGQKFDRQRCAAFARQRKKMEKNGIRRLVEMTPADVRAQFGQDGARQVYAYINLSEKVLFQCPPYVLNATLATAGHRLRAAPPVPKKGPRRARVKRSPRTIVPLPVRAPLGQQKRFRVPRSQG